MGDNCTGPGYMLRGTLHT